MSETLKYWAIELLLLIGSAAFAVLVVLPIINAGIEYQFLYFNLANVFLGTTLFRYIFYFDRHPLRGSKIFKVLVICSVPFLFFPLLEGIHSFLEFNDQEGLQSILTHIPLTQLKYYMGYIRLEYLTFGILAFVGSFFVIIKMIRSLWRQYKYNIT